MILGKLIKAGIISDGINNVLQGYIRVKDDQNIEFGTNRNQVIRWSSDGYLVGPCPRTGFWADCPVGQADPSKFYTYFDDFLKLPVDNTTANPTEWIYDGDADGDVTLMDGLLGGHLNVQTGATINNATCIHLGAGSTNEIFKITKDSGKKLWAEFRVKAKQHAAFGCLIGLAEVTVDRDLIADTTAIPDAGKKFIGFNILGATPAEWDAIWSTVGQASDAISNVVANGDDLHTFGIKFDGVNTVTFYVDGVAEGTTVAADAVKFPGDEELAPVVNIKTHATAAKEMEIDWIKVVQLR